MRTRSAYQCNGGFPDYAHEVKKPVDERRLQQAVMKATWHFAFNRHEYERVFRQYACRKLHCKPSAVKFCPESESLQRIRTAVLSKGTDFYGWTDGVTIHVSSELPMAFDELVGTLIHEELHCFCTARGKWLGAASDHHCMRVLGERF